MKQMNFRPLGWLILLAFLTWNCNDELDFLTDADARLEFSVDTLRFDTVFTEVGSATRSFRIRNNNDRPVRIAEVRLAQGTQSMFRMNVDGIPGNAVEDVVVYANDSIWVFVEVTIDPDQPLSVSPFVIEELIEVELNGNTQAVLVEAWGQNANYIPSRFSAGVPTLITCDNQVFTWDDPKPYVIYGQLFIDSCILEVAAGARIYVHGGIAQNDLFDAPFNDGRIYTLPNGQLRIRGTSEAPVVIQGDRLEETFQEEAGQWFGVIISRGSRGNLIEHTTIKNSIFGIYVDSSATLTLRNAQIYNTAGSGIVGVHSRIDAENTLVYNNFSTSVQLVHGGDYNFTYCTIASYGVDASALAMANFLCYDDPLECSVRSVYRLNATFRNSILFGSRRDEIDLLDISGGEVAGLFNIRLENCIVRIDELPTRFGGLYSTFLEETCTPCINGNNQTRLFADPNRDDYQLDSMSVAIGFADPIRFPRPIATDLTGNLRDTEQPDAGCFEYQE